ncbi:homing endonuclease associated repeat-containing protein [Natronorubrum texcoconense]|nr:helix-hairpin-helix domain-containing protein [Natronorubrum texcoconense]
MEKNLSAAKKYHTIANLSHYVFLFILFVTITSVVIPGTPWWPFAALSVGVFLIKGKLTSLRDTHANRLLESCVSNCNELTDDTAKAIDKEDITTARQRARECAETASRVEKQVSQFKKKDGSDEQQLQELRHHHKRSTNLVEFLDENLEGIQQAVRNLERVEKGAKEAYQLLADGELQAASNTLDQYQGALRELHDRPPLADQKELHGLDSQIEMLIETYETLEQRLEFTPVVKRLEGVLAETDIIRNKQGDRVDTDTLQNAVEQLEIIEDAIEEPDHAFFLIKHTELSLPELDDVSGIGKGYRARLEKHGISTPEELHQSNSLTGIDSIGRNRAKQFQEAAGQAAIDCISDLRSDLEERIERREQASNQLTYAERRYRIACDHLDRQYFSDVDQELTKAKEALESVPASGLQPEERTQFEKLEANIEKKRAELRTERLRKEFEDALDEIDTYIAEGRTALENESFDAATGKFGYATQCCNNAKEITSKVDDGEQAIYSRREKVNDLLEETRNRRQKHRVLDSMSTAETQISDGNYRVTDGSFSEAIENYNEAIDYLQRARQTAEENELSYTWEITERLEQVEQYRHHAVQERERQHEERREEAVYKLDRAEQLIEKGHQHLEVDDVDAAVESQQTAATLVTEATALFEEVDILETTEHRDRIDTLDQSVSRLDSSIDQTAEEALQAGGPSRQQLIQYLQDLAVMFDESPSEDFMREYGKYSIDEYYAAFGSWTDALREANLSPIDQAARNRRKYSRADILDAVVELAEQLGHNPSLMEMNRKGSISGTTVGTRFGDMDTAIELAGLKDVTLEYSETDIEEDTNEEEVTATVTTERTTTTAEPSEADLEELTEVSGVFQSDAAALAKDGYTSREKLKEASAEDLQAIDGIDIQLALRIKADIED